VTALLFSIAAFAAAAQSAAQPESAEASPAGTAAAAPEASEPVAGEEAAPVPAARAGDSEDSGTLSDSGVSARSAEEKEETTAAESHAPALDRSAVELDAAAGQMVETRERWKSLDVGLLIGMAMSPRSTETGTDKHLTAGLRAGVHGLLDLPLRAEITVTTDSIGRGESVAAIGISPWQVETLLLAGLDYTLADRGDVDIRLEALAGPGLSLYRIRYTVEEEGSASWLAQARLAARVGVAMRYDRLRVDLSVVGGYPLDPLARIWIGASYEF
jgi:hypothetical protein